MATITVMSGREVVQKLKLSGKELVIGRHDHADICLNHVMVSRLHAMLTSQNGLWRIEDKSGKNGVFINGQVSATAPLKNGDVIEIGKFLLKFSQSRDELDRDRAMAMNEPGADYKMSFDEMVTDVLGKDEEHEFVKNQGRVDTTESTMQLGAGQLENMRKEMGKRRQPHLIAVTPMPKSMYPLDKSEVSIGKGKNADVMVKGGLTTGKLNTTVSLFGDAWFAEHKSGFSGTKVNGKKISQRHRLREGDVIEVGDDKLKFMASVGKKK